MATSTVSSLMPRAAEIVHKLNPCVNALLLAKTHASMQREAMRKIDLELIDWLAPVYGNIHSGKVGKPITDPKHLWMMGDEEAANYYAERDKAIRKAGYDVKPGYCPALIAEEVERIAARTLIEASEEFFGTSADDLICSGIANYNKFVDLLIGLVVNHPNYRKPKI